MFAGSSLADCSARIKNGISDHQLSLLECPISGCDRNGKPSDPFVRDYTHVDDDEVISFVKFYSFHLMTQMTLMNCGGGSRTWSFVVKAPACL